MMERPRTHVESLDALRGIAALGVVIEHLCERWHLHHFPRHLYLAVPLFFTLSGYVIARSYEGRLRGSMTLWRFLEVRVIRLWPMLVIAAFLSGILGGFGWDVILAMFLIPSVMTLGLYPANGPEWSLLIEIVGNFAHAAVVRRLSVAAIIGIIALCSIIAFVAGYHFGGFRIGWGIGNLWGGFAIFGACYFIGVGIWRAHNAGCLPNASISIVWLFLIYAVAVCAPQAEGTLANAVRDFTCSVILFPSLVVFALNASTPVWLQRTATLAGEISYPLYITHFPIIAALAAVATSPRSPEWLEKLAGAAAVAACVAVAWLLYRFVDIPVRDRLSDAIRARRQQPSAGPA